MLVYLCIEGIIDREVWEGVHWRQLSTTQKKKILWEKIIINEKRTPTGTFEKVKSRLVVLGNLQKEADLCDDTLTSPTPYPHYTHTGCSSRSGETGGYHIRCWTGVSKRTAGNKKHIILRLSAPLVEILTQLDSSYRQYLCVDGTMLVKLKKALYGLRQAPRVWFDTIRTFLLYNGFHQSKLDDCFFWKKYTDGTSIDIAIHVDDGLVTTDTMPRLESLLVALKEKFKRFNARVPLYGLRIQQGLPSSNNYHAKIRKEDTR